MAARGVSCAVGCSLVPPAPGLALSEPETATVSRERRRIYVAAKEMASVVKEQIMELDSKTEFLMQRLSTIEEKIDFILQRVMMFTPVVPVPVQLPACLGGAPAAERQVGQGHQQLEKAHGGFEGEEMKCNSVKIAVQEWEAKRAQAGVDTMVEPDEEDSPAMACPLPSVPPAGRLLAEGAQLADKGAPRDHPVDGGHGAHVGQGHGAGGQHDEAGPSEHPGCDARGAAGFHHGDEAPGCEAAHVAHRGKGQEDGGCKAQKVEAAIEPGDGAQQVSIMVARGAGLGDEGQAVRTAGAHADARTGSAKDATLRSLERAIPGFGVHTDAAHKATLEHYEVMYKKMHARYVHRHGKSGEWLCDLLNSVQHFSNQIEMGGYSSYKDFDRLLAKYTHMISELDRLWDVQFALETSD